jgi:hypothetical protein
MKKIDLKNPTKIKLKHVIISIILCILGEIAIIYLFFTRPDLAFPGHYTWLVPLIIPLIPLVIWFEYKKNK